MVICGAVPSMVRSVQLHNDCSSNEIKVNLQGKVYASEEPNHGFNNLTLQSISFEKLTIFAERSQRYICFTRGWKLVGSKKFRGRRCEFEETMDLNGFNRYRSVANRNISIGFNKKGHPIRGPRTISNISLGKKGRGLEKCTRFLKIGVNLSQDITLHNRGDHHGNLKIPFKNGLLGPLPAASLSSVPLNNNELNKKNKKKKVLSSTSRFFDQDSQIPSTQLIKHPQRHKNKNHLRYS